MTGKEIARVDWPERNDRYGNLVRQNRNQIGMAYLDGKTPYILACRALTTDDCRCMATER